MTDYMELIIPIYSLSTLIFEYEVN